LSLTSKQIDELVVAGADALLARATNKRSLTAANISTRLRAASEKYILKHDPDAEGAAISSFANGRHADD